MVPLVRAPTFIERMGGVLSGDIETILADEKPQR